jgi:hypothetical protein
MQKEKRFFEIFQTEGKSCPYKVCGPAARDVADYKLSKLLNTD